MAKPPSKRDPARHTKKDPARPTRAKANRPDEPPTDPALARLLNPGIEKGTAGIGSGTGLGPGTGLRPPPDNSFDRRADFSAAHTARKSTRGFGEAPQRGYVAKGPIDLDPELASALGFGGSDPSRSVIDEAPPERDEISEISTPQRE